MATEQQAKLEGEGEKNADVLENPWCKTHPFSLPSSHLFVFSISFYVGVALWWWLWCARQQGFFQHLWDKSLMTAVPAGQPASSLDTYQFNSQ